MVDSNDRERAMEARDELYRVISDDAMPPRVPVVVVANKQDQPGKTSLAVTFFGRVWTLYRKQLSKLVSFQKPSLDSNRKH